VVPAASSDDSRPILTGVLLAAESGGLRLVATDSFRLAMRDVAGVSVLDEGQSVLIPSRALGRIR
ncbi:MAG: DNA polymerase III subunit beta, partial [Verrucomicrobiota bacterium]